jgi:hypothetical protein
MKSHLQATFAAITIATLAGCAAPLPKGSDTSKYLATPVDVSKMKPVEMTLKAKNGDEYDALRFHDVANNKWFDSDGYPVNQKFLRVLKTGEVCEGTKTALIGNGPHKYTISENTPIENCLEQMERNKADKSAMMFTAGSLVVITGIGGAAMAGATATGAAAGAVIEETKAAITNNDE